MQATANNPAAANAHASVSRVTPAVEVAARLVCERGLLPSMLRVLTNSVYTIPLASPTSAPVILSLPAAGGRSEGSLFLRTLSTANRELSKSVDCRSAPEPFALPIPDSIEFSFCFARTYETFRAPAHAEAGLRRPNLHGKSWRAPAAHSRRVSRPSRPLASREGRRHDRDVRLRAHVFPRNRRTKMPRSRTRRPRPPQRRMAIENRRRPVAAADVALLRRRPPAFPPHHGMGHDARLRPAPLRDLLRRRSRHHGSSQSRRRRSRRPHHRPKHPASSRAASQSLHFSRAELLLPLFFHAQTVVRANGQSADRFSRRLRHHGRAMGNAHAD